LAGGGLQSAAVCVLNPLERTMMMQFEERKEMFDANLLPQESTLLTFHGVEGYDVYNCSIPFYWNGTRYIYGRVEKRAQWARSWVRLFYETGVDDFTLVPNSMLYQLEDPYIVFIGDEITLGGTHVRKQSGVIETFFSYFYRGTDLEDLDYYTSGPQGMKDIRLVQLPQGIGVFSRPRGPEIQARFGSESIIGFTVISDLSDLTAEVVQNAPIVQDLFSNGEWGGCNQAYLLDTGLVGVIGHKSYRTVDKHGNIQSVYTNISYVMDPQTNRVLDQKLLATRASFPSAPAKKKDLHDCAFASGIVLRDDGKVDLYSGVGDTYEGRVVIDNPFHGFGDLYPQR